MKNELSVMSCEFLF